MLAIRLSRHGRSKRPFYRVVLTEHTKPAKSWYTAVLGSYDPLKHEFIADVPAIKEQIANGAKPSERIAKLLFKSTNDPFYKTFYKEIERKGVTRKEKKD
jgi:small subunit ribosomal protein S16